MAGINSIRSFAYVRSFAIIRFVSPRVSASAAAVTREGIIQASVATASREGLEAVTIGRLAEKLDMSKAGVIGPFGSKEELQLETFRKAVAMFTRDVWDPASRDEPGLPRRRATTSTGR